VEFSIAIWPNQSATAPATPSQQKRRFASITVNLKARVKTAALKAGKCPMNENNGQGWWVSVKKDLWDIPRKAIIATVVASFIGIFGTAFASVFKVEVPILSYGDKLDALTAISKTTQQGVDDNRKAIDDLRNAEPIVEWDQAASFIIGPCYIGEKCVAKLRLRRTAFGAGCEAPEATPYVRNHSRDPHRTTFVDFQPVQVGEEWETLTTPFIVPQGVQPGDSGYYVRTLYTKCLTDRPDVEFRRSSITLPFVAVVR